MKTNSRKSILSEQEFARKQIPWFEAELSKVLKSKNKERLRSLLEKGLEADSRNAKHPEPALITFARIGSAKMVKLVLSAGANIEIKYRHGFTALDVALWSGHRNIVQILSKAGLKSRFPIEKILKAQKLVDAIRKNNFKLVKSILNSGMDIKTQAYCNSPNIFWAVGNNREKILKLLIDSGSDVNETDNSGQTALFQAVWFGCQEATKILLQAGADPNVGLNKNRTPIFYAAEKGFLNIAKILIEHGANVNTHFHDGETPLSLAAREGHSRIVKLLESSGVRADQRIRSLMKTGMLVKAVKSGNAEKTRELLRMGLDVNARDYCLGWTLLMNAASRGYAGIVKILVEAGTDVNARDKYNLTASIVAEGKHRQKIIRMLRKAGTG